MNSENAKIVWKYIQKAGDDLQGKLPSHPNHPKGRNPYAHVALEVKKHFKMKLHLIKYYLIYLVFDLYI